MNALILMAMAAQMLAQVPNGAVVEEPCYPLVDGAWYVRKDNGEILHGYLRGDRNANPLAVQVWFMEAKGRIARLDGRLQHTSKSKIAESEEEPNHQYKGLIERYLQQEGRVEVTTPNGPLWVLASEADRAEKAREAAEALTPPEENPLAALLLDETEIEPGLESATVTGDGGPPGFLALWGPHILIAAVALALAGAVGYMTLLRE
jgi:hypothetical protein